MVAASTFPMFDKLFGGGLCDQLEKWRAPDTEGHQRSFDQIADLIEAEVGMRPGRETVRRWCAGECS